MILGQQQYTHIESSQKVDKVLLYLIILLSVVGFISLFNVSYPRSQVLYENPFSIITKQSIWFFIGGIIAMVLYSFDISRLRKMSPILILFSIILLLFSFIPGIGSEYLGGRRWIILFNISIQPSEFVKLSLVLYLAHILANRQHKMTDVMNTILPAVVVVAVVVGIIYLQNDFSTAVFIFCVAPLMFFVAGVAMRHFLLLFSVAVPVMAILLFTREYRVQRLISFLMPDRDPTGSGFQILAAKSALAQGAFWGKGIGLSQNKFGVLPEVQSDFILAIIGEELGFLGICLVLGFFTLFALRGYAIIYQSEDRFIQLCAFGLTSVVFLQALINAAVVIGLLPTTGITLPFFSAGGSSLVTTLAICGVLLLLSRERKLL